jgi:hypothetical protein
MNCGRYVEISGYFKVISLYFPGDTEENLEEPYVARPSLS